MMTKTTSKKNGTAEPGRKQLPRYTRASKDALPGFRLTERDIAIVEAVYLYRALTGQQIEQLFFSLSTRTQRTIRLQKLFHHGLLVRTEQPQSLTEGRKPFVYWLDNKGAELLAIQQGIEVSDLAWKPGAYKVKPLFLDHLLATNTVRIAITRAGAHHGYVLEEWRDDATLRRDHAGETVIIRGAQGNAEPAAFVPDGYFSFAADEYFYRCFLEVDRRTVTGASETIGAHDWARKVKTYLAYFNSDKIVQRYGSRSGRVVTVTTGEKRAANLKAITEREGGKARFWFTTFAQVTPETVLTEPIWLVAGKDGLQRLI